MDARKNHVMTWMTGVTSPRSARSLARGNTSMLNPLTDRSRAIMERQFLSRSVCDQRIYPFVGVNTNPGAGKRDVSQSHPMFVARVSAAYRRPMASYHPRPLFQIVKLKQWSARSIHSGTCDCAYRHFSRSEHYGGWLFQVRQP